MKTYEMIRLSKGCYLRTYFNGRVLSSTYYEKLTTAREKIADLKKEGYVELV